MATAARVQTGADFGLSVGPLPDSVDANNDKVFFGMSTSNVNSFSSGRCIGHPSIWKPRAAKLALNSLRLQLLGNAE